jgi:hypothetical protein
LAYNTFCRIFFKLKYQLFLKISGEDKYVLLVAMPILLSLAIHWFFGGLYLIMDITLKPNFMRKYKVQLNKNEPVDTTKLLKVRIFIAKIGTILRHERNFFPGCQSQFIQPYRCRSYFWMFCRLLFGFIGCPTSKRTVSNFIHIYQRLSRQLFGFRNFILLLTSLAARKVVLQAYSQATSRMDSADRNYSDILPSS